MQIELNLPNSAVCSLQTTPSYMFYCKCFQNYKVRLLFDMHIRCVTHQCRPTATAAQLSCGSCGNAGNRCKSRSLRLRPAGNVLSCCWPANRPLTPAATVQVGSRFGASTENDCPETRLSSAATWYLLRSYFELVLDSMQVAATGLATQLLRGAVPHGAADLFTVVPCHPFLADRTRCLFLS